jgi:hypothetical protein
MVAPGGSQWPHPLHAQGNTLCGQQPSRGAAVRATQRGHPHRATGSQRTAASSRGAGAGRAPINDRGRGGSPQQRPSIGTRWHQSNTGSGDALNGHHGTIATRYGGVWCEAAPVGSSVLATLVIFPTPFGQDHASHLRFLAFAFFQAGSWAEQAGDGPIILTTTLSAPHGMTRAWPCNR